VWNTDVWNTEGSRHMQQIREKEFKHDGKAYVVKAFADEEGIKVRAFLDERPANRFTYSITWETNMDLKMVMGLSGIDVLMQQAEEDVRQGLQ